MKYLSLTLLIIAAMATNMMADLNFPDGSHDAKGWDFICGVIIFLGLIMLLLIAILDTVREFDR